MLTKKCRPPMPVSTAPPHQGVNKVYAKDLHTVRSLSNPSFQSQAEETDDQLEVTLSQQFNDAFMEVVYNKYSLFLGNPNDFMPSEVTKQIIGILQNISLDENISFLAMKFYDSIIHVDDAWNMKFGICAERNFLKFAERRGYPIEYRIMSHIMAAFRAIKYIGTSLEDGRFDDAVEMLDMIALSHSAMAVKVVYFRTFIIRLIKSLIHYKFINEDLMPPFVYFGVTIINYITKRVRAYERRHPILLKEMIDGHTAPSRAYYRELKKWKRLVWGIYKSLKQPLAAFDRQLGSSHKLDIMMTETQTQEQWKIIRLLKKGYKYRNMEPQG